MILILPDGKKTQSQSQDPQHEGPSASGSIEVQEERVEDSYRPNAVVVENIAEDMTRELLGLIVENITGISEDDYSMELIYESCVAVVTFTHPDGMYLVLFNLLRHYIFCIYIFLL